MRLNPEKYAFGVSSVSEVAVSAVLVREDQGKQSPIYYVSKSLLDAETQYPYLEKLALVFIMELSGRLAKWAIELSEYDIICQPRIAIKSQVLANFVADFSQGIQLEAEKELQVFNGSNPGTWTLLTDGSSNVKGAGLVIVLVPPTGETIRQAKTCHPITNNEAEYEVVIAGLELARDLGIEQHGILPEDKRKAQSHRKNVARYCLKKRNLYRKCSVVL
ncbi:uncharacterized protein [Nicotiana sylvestris]|uniref:uncharacterized protein n=1 Tax=Nicotiana sylvestris TaxID=4096 RepID=UPI00388C46F9